MQTEPEEGEEIGVKLPYINIYDHGYARQCNRNLNRYCYVDEIQ